MDKPIALSSTDGTRGPQGKHAKMFMLFACQIHLVSKSVRPSVRPFFRPSVRPSVRPSARSSVRPPVRPSVRPPVRPSVRPSYHDHHIIMIMVAGPSRVHPGFIWGHPSFIQGLSGVDPRLIQGLPKVTWDDFKVIQVAVTMKIGRKTKKHHF